MSEPVRITLTWDEARMVALCLGGEIENDDGRTPTYFPVLVTARRKLLHAMQRVPNWQR